jgi:hypothetical protein
MEKRHFIVLFIAVFPWRFVSLPTNPFLGGVLLETTSDGNRAFGPFLCDAKQR